MKAFAFVVPAITIKEIKNFWPITRIMPDFFIKPFFKSTPPFRVARIKKVRSIQGKETEGFFIICPLLSKYVQETEKALLDKVIAAGSIAEQLGAKILGLGRCLSIIGDRIYDVSQKLKIAVTSGDALNAWSIFEAIYRVARLKNIDLKKSTLAIIEATDSVGSLCARKLSYYVSKIVITASSSRREKLEHLKETILHLNPIEISIEEDVHKALKDADVAIITNSSSGKMFNIEEFKPKAIICVGSVLKNRFAKVAASRDITIIEVGLIKMPSPAEFGINTGLPKGIVSAALAETMLLAFEERFISYSLGDNINLDKLEEIADIATRHGFEVWVPQAPVL